MIRKRIRYGVSPVMSSAILLTITLVLGTVLWGSYFSASNILINNLNTEYQYTWLKFSTSLSISYIASNGTHVTLILYNNGRVDLVVTEIEFWESYDTLSGVLTLPTPIEIAVGEVYGPITFQLPTNSTSYIVVKIIPKPIYEEGSDADKIRFTIEVIRRIVSI